MCKKKTFTEARSSAIGLIEDGIGLLQASSGDFGEFTSWFHRLSGEISIVYHCGLINSVESEIFTQRVRDIYLGSSR